MTAKDPCIVLALPCAKAYESAANGVSADTLAYAGGNFGYFAQD